MNSTAKSISPASANTVGHTPGPWVWRDGVLYGAEPSHLHSIINDDGCKVHRAPIGAAKAPPVDEWFKEIAADRHLIAAAPDLLAALKGVVAVADRNSDEFNAARAAIARAEGRS